MVDMSVCVILLLSAVTTVLSFGTGVPEVTPIWNMYKWGPNAQAWCRFRCQEKLSAGQIFTVNFSGPTSKFTAYDNLRVLSTEGTSYTMENNYDIWPWGGDAQFCQFQFGLVYEGVGLQGNCSMHDSVTGYQTFQPQHTGYQTFQPQQTDVVPHIKPLQTQHTDLVTRFRPLQPQHANIVARIQPLQTINTNPVPYTRSLQPHHTDLSSHIDLAMWDNTFDTRARGWKYQGRCTVACLGTYEPGTLKVIVDLDKDTTNFNGFGAYEAERSTIGTYSRKWTVVNQKRIKSQYGLCHFDLEMDHQNEYPIPSGTCYTI